MNEIQDILSFWFGEDPSRPLLHSERWWRKDADFDEEIRDLFQLPLGSAARGEFDAWSECPTGALALIILLDQFSRNIYRDKPKAFAQDAKALAISLKAQEQGFEAELGPVQRWFLYMPMMHSEDPEVQTRSVEKYRALEKSAPPDLVQALRGAREFAERHAEIVKRFGRFPHRNEILGRNSTPEERAFLKEPNSSF